MVEAVKQSLLLVAKQRHTQQRRIGLTHKGGNGQADCIGQALHQALGVSSVVIFYVHAVLAIEFPDVKRNAELRHIQLEILHLKRCALTLVVSKQPELIGEHDFGSQVVVRSNLGKRIVLVSERRVEVLARLPYELHYALRTDVGAEGKRVDEHAYRALNAEVAATAADCGDAQALVVGEARQGIEHGSQSEMSRRDLMLAAEVADGIHVNGRGGYSDDALVMRVRQVRRNLSRSFYCPQATLEVIACSGIVSALLCLLLCHDEGRIAHNLGFYLATIHQVAQLMEEDVVRTAVEHEMMEVREQIDLLRRLHNLQPVQRPLVQVEGPYELELIICQLFLAHLSQWDVDRLLQVLHLSNFGVFCLEMNAQLRMSLHKGPQGCGKSLHVGRERERYLQGYIVDSRGGVLHAIHIDTCLGIAQGNLG